MVRAQERGVGAADLVLLTLAEGATDDVAADVVGVAAGSCRIRVRNLGGVPLAGPVSLHFALLKSEAA